MMAFIDLIAIFPSLSFFLGVHSAFLFSPSSIFSDTTFLNQVGYNNESFFQNFCLQTLHSPHSPLHAWGSRVHDTLPLEEQDELSLGLM